MKKIKIMLLVTLVVAAVGGALAFKSATMHARYFCKQAGAEGQCQDLYINYTTEGNTFFPLECSTQSGSDCPLSITTNQ